MNLFSGMGLLSEGSPLSWEETKKQADHVRKHGIQQFINQYNKLKDRKKDVLYWGDEVCHVFSRSIYLFYSWLHQDLQGEELGHVLVFDIIWGAVMSKANINT